MPSARALLVRTCGHTSQDAFGIHQGVSGKHTDSSHDDGTRVLKQCT